MCADTISPDVRSRNMSRIRGRDTGPERTVRGLLTSMGYRYRLQYSRLPGRPDIAMPGRKRVLWIHGCFWHQHSGCRRATMPKTRPEFWRAKLEGNRARDERNKAMVESLGWSTFVLWECELQDIEDTRSRLSEFLGPNKRDADIGEAVRRGDARTPRDEGAISKPHDVLHPSMPADGKASKARHSAGSSSHGPPR